MNEFDEDYEDPDATCIHGNYYNQVECEECINDNEIHDELPRNDDE